MFSEVINTEESSEEELKKETESVQTDQIYPNIRPYSQL